MFHLMAVHGASGRRRLVRDRSCAVHRPRTNAVPRPHAMAGRGRCRARRLGAGSDRRDPLSRDAASRTQTVTRRHGHWRGETREACLRLIEKYQDRHLADRVFDLAWTHSQVVLRQINATEADAQLYGRLAGCVIYANASLRADAGA